MLNLICADIDIIANLWRWRINQVSIEQQLTTRWLASKYSFLL